MARVRTAAGRGPGEANGCGAGTEVLWEGLSRWGPAVWGRSVPPPETGGGWTGESLSAPPSCPYTRLGVWDPAGATALSWASPRGWRLPQAGAVAGPRPGPWLPGVG